jgi:hypothetical protein
VSLRSTYAPGWNDSVSMKATRTESALLLAGAIVAVIALWLVGTRLVPDTIGGTIILAATILAAYGWWSFARRRALPGCRKQWSSH